MGVDSDRRTFVRTAAAGTALALGGGAVPSVVFGADPRFGGREFERASSPPAASASEMPFFDVIRGRRSVRRFTPDPVPEEDLLQILDAARLAPTAGNQQPWKFLVVRERSTIDQMMESCVSAGLEARQARGGQVTEETRAAIREALEGYFSAPVYVVVLTDNESRYPTYNHWDGPLAAGYLMLAARALGYGTVFITDAIPPAVTREVLEIPDRYTRVCITPVGVPEAWPESPDKKDLGEMIVRERF